MWKKSIQHFVPDAYRQDEESYRKASLLLNALFIIVIFTYFYAGVCQLIGYREGFWIQSLAGIVYAIMPFAFRYRLSHVWVTVITLGVATTAICGDIWYSGGHNSPVLPWLTFPPIVVLLLGNKTSGWVFALVCYCLVFAFGWLNLTNYPWPKNYNLAYEKIFAISCYTGLVLIIFLISLVFENAKTMAMQMLAQKNELIEQERKRSDELLQNILPQEIMEELKQTGKTTARYYDLVTVMFIDFKDFTLISDRLAPEELVSGVDKYFETFDRIIDQRQVEKIKTIGDAYLCAAGIPVPNASNPVQMIDTAFLIVEATKKLNQERAAAQQITFDIRIGIHSGPLVAGVVGIKKFAYDIWGDAVNTAARMQQAGGPGKINISGTTYELVKHRFNCTHRGRIEAKNKGEIDMYFVEAKKPVPHLT